MNAMENNRGLDLPQRLIALGLCLLLCFQLLPVTAMAGTTEELAAKKTLMEESWTRLIAPIEELAAFIVNFRDYKGKDTELQAIEQKSEALSEVTGIYQRLAEDYYEAYAIAADAAVVKADMGAQLATWTDFLANFCYYPPVDKQGVNEDATGVLKARYKAFEALEGVKTSVSGLIEEVSALKEMVSPSTAEPDDMAAKEAWAGLVTAQNAYAAALATITGFADAYYEKMRAWVYQGKTSAENIYDPARSQDHNKDYAHVQDSFEWYAEGDVNLRVDTISRYQHVNGELKTAEEDARDALETLKALYDAFDHALENFYAAIPGRATISEMQEWCAQILKWEGEYEEYFKDWESHRFVDTLNGKYYSKRFPHYDFLDSGQKLFKGGIASLSNGITYRENGLELAYYIDCEGVVTLGERTVDAYAYLGHKAYWELSRSEGKSHSLYKIREKLENAAGIIHQAAEMKAAGNELKAAWTALYGFNVKTADEDALASATALNNWAAAAGRYNSMLYQYATREVKGIGVYLSRHTNLIYGVEKLQGMAEFYRQEYSDAVATWKSVQNSTETVTLKNQRVVYCENAVSAQQKLCRQVDELVADAMQVLFVHYGVTLDPKVSLAQQLDGQMALMENASRTSLENALNPYSDYNLATLTNAQLGVDTENGITRNVAMRSYLRLQKANLQLWHDISEETVGICANIVSREDTKWRSNDMVSGGSNQELDNGNIFDLRMTRVENCAYAAYSGCMLKFAEDAFEEYDRLGVPEGTTGEGATSETINYDTAKEKWEAAKRARDTAAQDEANKLTELNTVQNNTAATTSEKADARSAYEAAQKVTKEKETAVAEAAKAMYRAAANSGKAWQTDSANSANVSTWLAAYRNELVADAQTAYNAKAGAYNTAKQGADYAKSQLSEKKTAMETAESAMNKAKATYSDLVTELNEKQATMKEAEDTEAYAQAQSDYNDCTSRTDAAFTELKTKASAYNTAVAEYEAAQEEYDKKLATATTLKKEIDALWETYHSLNTQTEFTYPAVPTIDPTNSGDYTAYTLELMIEEARERIEICQTGANNIYLEMKSDFASMTDVDGTGARKGEKIYQFNAYVWELEGQEARLADLEKAMALKYYPNTLDGAIYSAKVAVEDYYFAQRDFYEFQDLEYYMASYLNDKNNRQKVYKTNSSGSGTIGDVGVLPLEHPEAYTIREAAQIVAARYQEELEELEQTMSKQEETMNQKLRELQAQEIRYEKTLKTEAQINARVNQLQMELLDQTNGKKALYQSEIVKVFTNKETVIKGEMPGYSHGMFLLAAYDMANDPNLSWEDFCAIGYFLNTLKQSGVASVTGEAQKYYDYFGRDKRAALSAAVRTFGNDKYHKAYIDFKIAEALFGENNEDRNNMLARINRMGDQYALQVNTGSVDGNGVLFFSVAYMDTDGFERKEYIFPFVDGYENTLKEAGATMAENLQAESGVTVDPLACAVNQGHIDTMAKLGQSGKLEGNPPLQTWSSDIYMFRTQYEMADTAETKTPDVRYFETFVERQKFTRPDGTVIGTAKNTWACTAMRLFHLDDFYGVSAYGYGGGPQTQLQLEFKGQRIATLKNSSAGGGSISWDTDELITMGQTGDAKYSIDHTEVDYYTGKVGPNSGGGALDQVSDEDSEYLFELDFDDSYGAGIEALVNMVTDTRASDIELDTVVTGPMKMTASTEEKAYTSNSMGVSIDPSAKTSIWDMGLAECLTYVVVYMDSTGTKRQVSIPVITSSLAWALDHGASGDEKLFGYAQQGDSIVFSAYLPEMEEMVLEECGLMFNYVNDWEQSGQQSSKATDNFDARESLIKEDVEVRLSGIQVYKPGTYQASADVVQGRIVPTVTNKEGSKKTPTYYELKGEDSKGVLYEYGKKTKPDLKLWTQGNILTRPWDCTSLYMLVIQTDDPPLAGTEASPSVTLNYTTESGRTKTSRSASLEGDGLDFYGYWPGYENREMTVLQATGAKGQLKLLYNLKDENGTPDAIKSFNSVTISMPENTNDDWQISDMYIMKVNHVGERFAVWENITDSNGNLLSDRRYDRTVQGQVMTSSIDTSQGKILLQSGDSKVISFSNGGNTEVIATETDWGSVQYYMDYDTAMGEFGFTKTRETYTVKVQVNDEGASTVNNGDCGSNNNFYFQLIFANGRSAYVLANQQLSGDGFRTGYVETFNIKTNRDYGELQAVRIIPDDNSSDSELFDKLNIKRIRVSKNGNDSVNRTWVITDIGDNGWISFDYHDDAESYGVLGRPGRSESELCVNCPVGYVTYSTKLLFALATDPVENDTMTEMLRELEESGADADTIKKCQEVINGNPQYQGQLSMTLLYRNNQGNVESMTVDVVGAMAAYANKVADREEKIDSQGNVITGTQYLSTKEYMFRPGHTDRFEIDVSDITEIVSIDLIPTSAATQSSFWKVKALDVFMLKGEGILNINVNNEYQKTNEVEYLCSAKNVPFTFYCPAANPEKKSFTVTDNRLDVKSEAGETTWTVAVSREPESRNDVANIYIYATSATMDADAEVNKLYTQMQYTNSYGQIYKSALRDMTMISGVEGGCLFYTAGVDIANISVLNSISAELASTESTVTIDHIVVQQVRSGVVISTYTITPGVNDRILGSSCKKRSFMPDNTASVGEIIGRGDKQIVTIGFGSNTETARLVDENRDIGIALRYTSTNDVAATKQVYQSPYIYLTDQDIIAICAGGTAQIEFHEQYVDEIEGIVAFATGGLKADISSVSIESLKAGLEGATDDKYTRRGWYSVVETKALDIGGQKFNTYKGNAGGTNRIVSPYTVELTTGAVAPTDSKLEMVLKYKKLNSTESGTITFPNIRNNLVSGGFSANQKAVIRVMLNESVGEVLSVAFRPTGTNASWSITALRTELAYDGKGVNITETKTATSEYPAVFGVKVDNGASLFVSAECGWERVSNTLSGDMTLNNVGAGDSVTISASVSGSEDTILIDVRRIELDGTTTDVKATTLSGGGGNWTFTSSYGMDATYRITVSLEKHSDKKAVITIYYKVSDNNEGDALTLNLFSLDLTAGTGQYQLTATNGIGTITWSSSDDTVATVENGLVKATPEAQTGATALITARDSAGHEATCQIQLVENAGN